MADPAPAGAGAAGAQPPAAPRDPNQRACGCAKEIVGGGDKYRAEYFLLGDPMVAFRNGLPEPPDRYPFGYRLSAQNLEACGMLEEEVDAIERACKFCVKVKVRRSPGGGCPALRQTS